MRITIPNGNTPMDMTSVAYGHALIEWARVNSLEDVSDVAAAHDALSNASRIEYDRVRRTLGL